MQKFSSIEEFGVKSNESTMPKLEQQRQEMMKDSLAFKGNRYEKGLLWKEDNQQLPNSYP